MIKKIVHTKDEHEFIEKASIFVLEQIQQTLLTQDFCRLGLSGGTTPKKLYHRLSQLHIPWERMIVIVIDERNVPLNDPKSNYGMIRDELISGIEIPDDQIIFFDTGLGYDSAVLTMEQKLIQLKKDRLPLFDLLILGAGPDGHIAGIFPDSLSPKNGFLTMKTHTNIFDVSDRLTCTMEALTSCQHALLLLKGHEKVHLLEQIERGDTHAPIGRFIEKIPTEIIAVQTQR